MAIKASIFTFLLLILLLAVSACTANCPNCPATTCPTCTECDVCEVCVVSEYEERCKDGCVPYNEANQIINLTNVLIEESNIGVSEDLQLEELPYYGGVAK